MTTRVTPPAASRTRPAARASTRLRRMLRAGRFVEMPSVFDALSARLVEACGFPAAYNGGFATGASTAITEPQLTMTEQVSIAGAIARRVAIPVVADAGAGWGDPLHTMRTIAEFIAAGVAGVHLEDQLFPKRAHYHAYVEHMIPLADYAQKVRYACRERDRRDPDFVLIARSDACRIAGLAEAIRRIDRAAEEGADAGMVFPRTPAETARAPKLSRLPLVYVQSRGNRDGRPLYNYRQLEDMGYAMVIDAIWSVAVAQHYMRRALEELRATGDYSGMTEAEFVVSRQQVEDLIGLDEHYRIERETVERPQRGTRRAR